MKPRRKQKEEENMKAIFIDAVNRKVEEVQIKNELHAFYDRLGCRMIQCVGIGGGHLVIVDEEGRLRDWKVGFRLPGSKGIAGNGLIVCDNGKGDFTDIRAPVELFELCTQFLDLIKTPLPPPAFGFALLPDLKPDTIRKARIEARRNLEWNRRK